MMTHMTTHDDTPYMTTHTHDDTHDDTHTMAGTGGRPPMGPSSTGGTVYLATAMEKTTRSTMRR